jgi:hypothetical protein
MISEHLVDIGEVKGAGLGLDDVPWQLQRREIGVRHGLDRLRLRDHESAECRLERRWGLSDVDRDGAVVGVCRCRNRRQCDEQEEGRPHGDRQPMPQRLHPSDAARGHVALSRPVQPRLQLAGGQGHGRPFGRRCREGVRSTHLFRYVIGSRPPIS